MTPHAPTRLPALGGKTRILLAVALVLAAVVLLFDWNLLRGPVTRHLAERSGREVRIGHLHVAPGFGLQPAITLRDVYIQNAPWASDRPLLAAGEISFTVSLESVIRGRPIVSRLVLVDAHVDLERQADGRRNWRLRNPEDRGPGRTVVQTLQAQRSQLHFVNRAIDLSFMAAVGATDADDRGAKAEKLSTRIAFEGRYSGRAFSGAALSSGTISFRESGSSFALRGHIVSDGTRLDFDGSFTDVFDLGPMDARVRLAGPSLALIHPFVRARPPESQPYTAEARLTQARHVYRFADLAARIGISPLTGEVTYDRSAGRPSVSATLHSDTADFDDLRPLLGMTSRKTMRPGVAVRNDRKADRSAQSPQAGGLPTRPLRLDALRATDVRAALSMKRFTAGELPALENVRLEANLRDGQLTLQPFHAQVAGGNITGSLSLDAREAAPAARLVADLQGVRVERLMPGLAAKSSSSGALDVRVELSGKGDSITAMIARSAGTIALTLHRGSISNLADAKLGLDFGKVVGVFLRGDRIIAINCGAAVFDVRDGIGRSRKIVFDTEQTHVDGSGSVDLRKRHLDLLVTPEPRNPGLFTRRASIRLQGPLGAPAVSLEERVEQKASAAGRC